MRFIFLLLIVPMISFAASSKPEPPPPAPQHEPPPENRVASFYLSQDFINEQLAAHTKTAELVKEMKVEFDPDHNRVLLRGRIQVPIEELRAVKLAPHLGSYRFQVTIHPEATPEGYLILDFPLSETFFYPATSKNPKRDRVIVPVQMISLALASARGYLAALSGDFSSFERRTKKLNALIKSLSQVIAKEENEDAKEDLVIQRDSLKLQLAAVPIERKQLQNLGKDIAHLMSFTGEKELDFNEDLGARENALIFKLKLSQLAPFLSGAELGGVRIRHDKKDGGGQNYLVVDLNSTLTSPLPPRPNTPRGSRPGMKVAPAMIMRLNQALLQSTAVVEAQKKKMPSKLRNLEMQLKDDGLHVTGDWHTFLFNVPFDTTVDILSTALDVFEVRVRNIEIAGLDLDFLAKYVLQSMKERLDEALKGICTFKYLGTTADNARTLQVTVEPKALVPAFPDLHLIDVDVREREFLLKIGH